MSYVRQNAPTIPFFSNGSPVFSLVFFDTANFPAKNSHLANPHTLKVFHLDLAIPILERKSSLRLLNVKACALIVPLGTSYHRNYPYLTYRQFFLLTVRILLQLLGDIMERINDTLVSLCMAVCGTDCCSVRKQ